MAFSIHLLTSTPLSPEKSGKTIHLLKSKSKKIEPGRKKRKIPTLGTFSDFKESKKKQFQTQKPPTPTTGPTPLFPQPPKPVQGSIQQLLAGATDNAKKEAKMSHK